MKSQHYRSLSKWPDLEGKSTEMGHQDRDQELLPPRQNIDCYHTQKRSTENTAKLHPIIYQSFRCMLYLKLTKPLPDPLCKREFKLDTLNWALWKKKTHRFVWNGGIVWGRRRGHSTSIGAPETKIGKKFSVKKFSKKGSSYNFIKTKQAMSLAA